MLLSHNAVLAVLVLLAGKIDVPELPPGNPEQDVGAPSEPSDAIAQPAAEVQTFIDRIFMRKSLDKTVDLFIRGLIQEYRESGCRLSTTMAKSRQDRHALLRRGLQDDSRLLPLQWLQRAGAPVQPVRSPRADRLAPQSRNLG